MIRAIDAPLLRRPMKQTFLDFEQPIAELQAKIDELRYVHEDSAVDISDEISRLAKKSQQLTKDIYGKLTSWQIAQVARHPQRPYTLDYIAGMFSDFHELAGDRSYADDAAIVGGIARFNGQPCMVIGHQKGRDTKEKIHRNFGMPRPEGYRKALRLMKLAEKFGLPLFTFVDTPGAYPGIGAEERGQSEAIGRNLYEMAGLRVPIIVTVIGEGGSGGALAIAIGDVTLMLQYSTYSVISPEGCASILWKSADQASEAAEVLGITVDAAEAAGADRQDRQRAAGRRAPRPRGDDGRAEEGAGRGAAPTAGPAARHDARGARGQAAIPWQVQGALLRLNARRRVPRPRDDAGPVGTGTSRRRTSSASSPSSPRSARRRCRSVEDAVRRAGARRRSLAGHRPRVAIALSGGRDSMALLDAAVRAAATLPVELSAVHVHHGLSPHADDWAAFCGGACRERGVALTIRRVDVARRGGQSLEAAARSARYAAFAGLEVDVIALAHHADDQAETLLLQLLRGAGPHGAAAMARCTPARATGPALLRPLLGLPRRAIDAYVGARGIAHVDDESNADVALRRNRLRHEVAPLLAAAFPGYPQTLVRAAGHQAEAAQLLDELAALDARGAVAPALPGTAPTGGGVLDRRALAALSDARARNLLRWFLRRHDLRAPSAARLASMLEPVRRIRRRCPRGDRRTTARRSAFTAGGSRSTASRPPAGRPCGAASPSSRCRTARWPFARSPTAATRRASRPPRWRAARWRCARRAAANGCGSPPAGPDGR